MIEFLVLGLACAIVLVLWKSRMNYLALGSLLSAPPGAEPDVTIVIPARNEAQQIARVVSSFPNLRVIVADDASTDETSQVAQQAGAQVVSAYPLPPNAKGKPNACAEGARYVTSKWILFVDADTWFAPAFAASIVAYAEANRVQMVSAFLKQQCETLAEKAILPYAFALYFTAVSARRVNSAKSKEALANGQCVLFERSAYESIGGHQAVLDSVIEDVALARHAKRSGLTVKVIRAENLGSVRMYDGFAAMWRGFQKNSFRFLLVNPWCGIQVVIASILLTSWLPVLALGLRDYPKFSLSVLLAPTPLTLLLVAPFLSLMPWYRGWSAVLAPLGIYLFQLIALNGMFATLGRKKTVWKNRDV
jgi:cellulose synthase/poly-beta-1,6-N-acetylglucosamine synthase-like glycosyltransferase